MTPGAQRDGVRHFLFHLPRHEAEVAALDAEAGADDQQVAFQVRDAVERALPSRGGPPVEDLQLHGAAVVVVVDLGRGL